MDPLLLRDEIPNVVSLPLLVLNPCTVLVIAVLLYMTLR
jgi:hypothetical protein